MVACLKDEATNMVESDAAVIVLVSHGSKGCVYGADGHEVPIGEIQEIFNGENSPTLNGKPKIFIIQACQGCEF